MFLFSLLDILYSSAGGSVFTLRGFSNWKAALESDRGLQKDAASHGHVQAAAATWSEHKARDATGTTVNSLLVGKTARKKNQYYVKSVSESVQFLCVNELGLRGTTDKCKSDHSDSDEEPEDNASGLFFFCFCFEYTLRMDDKMAAISKHT